MYSTVATKICCQSNLVLALDQNVYNNGTMPLRDWRVYHEVMLARITRIFFNGCYAEIYRRETKYYVFKRTFYRRTNVN
jgi:hypothetical protein